MRQWSARAQIVLKQACTWCRGQQRLYSSLRATALARDRCLQQMQRVHGEYRTVKTTALWRLAPASPLKDAHVTYLLQSDAQRSRIAPISGVS